MNEVTAAGVGGGAVEREIVVAFALPDNVRVGAGPALIVWGGQEIRARPLYTDFCGPESFAQDVEAGMAVGIRDRNNWPTPDSAVTNQEENTNG